MIYNTSKGFYALLQIIRCRFMKIFKAGYTLCTTALTWINHGCESFVLRSRLAVPGGDWTDAHCFEELEDLPKTQLIC